METLDTGFCTKTYSNLYESLSLSPRSVKIGLKVDESVRIDWNCEPINFKSVKSKKIHTNWYESLIKRTGVFLKL